LVAKSFINTFKLTKLETSLAAIIPIAKWLAKIKQRLVAGCRLQCRRTREQSGVSTENVPEEMYWCLVKEHKKERHDDFDPITFNENIFWNRRPYGTVIDKNDRTLIDDCFYYLQQ